MTKKRKGTSLTLAVNEALEAGASGEEIAGIPVSESYLAATLSDADVGTLGGAPSSEKRPSAAIKLREVPTPEIRADEVLIAVMASSMDFNTVWSTIFEPVPTFGFLKRYAKVRKDLRHAQEFHVVGSDASGVVLRAGEGVTRWKPGDRVVVHPNDVALQDPQGHNDAMHDPDQRVWGYETNYGGLAELCVVKANMLMPKADHLSWEEAASMPLVNCTAYRMLVSPNGAHMRQGDIVLIWGAGGGLGGFALQYVLNGGGRPVCVVSSEEKAQKCHEVGAEWVIDRKALGFKFWNNGRQDSGQAKRFRDVIREHTGGRDVDIVFEHPGRDTFGASVYVTRRAGKIVTCASTTGFMHEFDNRYLWMFTKTIIGSHLANYAEGWAANELVRAAKTYPILSRVYPLAEVGKAADDLRSNVHTGKLGVLCIANDEHLGVDDGELRAQHLDDISMFRVPT